MKKEIVKSFREYCNGRDCDECKYLHSRGMANCSIAFALDYLQEKDMLVNVPNIEVDTLVRVRDSEDESWVYRYFHSYNSEDKYYRYRVWANGATSKTAEGGTVLFKYCEVVE